MKTLLMCLLTLICCISLPNLLDAQHAHRQAGIKIAPRQPQLITPTKVRLRTDRGVKLMDYVPKSKLREGRNFVRFGNRRMFVGVKAGRVVNVKVMNPVGKWGPNVLSAGQQVLEFSCVGGICWCSGDNDCNDMFVSNICGDAAVCIDDKCYCAQN